LSASVPVRRNRVVGKSAPSALFKVSPATVELPITGWFRLPGLGSPSIDRADGVPRTPPRLWLEAVSRTTQLPPPCPRAPTAGGFFVRPAQAPTHRFDDRSTSSHRQSDRHTPRGIEKSIQNIRRPHRHLRNSISSLVTVVSVMENSRALPSMADLFAGCRFPASSYACFAECRVIAHVAAIPVLTCLPRVPH